VDRSVSEVPFMARSLIECAPELMRRALRFLLPADCAACHAPLSVDPIPHFCSDCWSAIVPPSRAACARCDRPFVSPLATAYSPHHLCHSCAERPPAYTKAWTLYPYRPPLQDAICLFKYRGKVALATPLAGLMIDRLPPLESIDLAMPVPLHVERLREREFNQALLLADRIGRYLGVPVSCSDLIRTAPAPAQTTLSRKDRLRNLRGAFAVPRPESIAGKRILLIDDVFTTGATVNECAKTLRKAGSGDVFVLTLGRTVDTSLVPDRVLAQRSRATADILGG
jgi:ComF family protein